MPCPYCTDNNSSLSYLPSTSFNNKTFQYLKCFNCGVVYINPFPNTDDYLKMYPPEYQSGIDKTILYNPFKKLSGLRFSYGFQFDLIKKYFKGNPVILDFGCGNGNFIINSKHSGFECDGVEFNEKHIEILKKGIPSSNFYSTKEFLNSRLITYDVIRLSNVLEHLDIPIEIIELLISKLNKNGLLLIEGPIELNFNIAFLTRKVYFVLKNIIKGKYIATHLPTHITFTNYKNQLLFFNQFELTPLQYTISESAWPYPNSLKLAKGFGGKVKAIIAQLSIIISSILPKWGNTFIYVGRKK